jgi:hypothetical protein
MTMVDAMAGSTGNAEVLTVISTATASGISRTAIATATVFATATTVSRTIQTAGNCTPRKSAFATPAAFGAEAAMVKTRPTVTVK